MNPEANPMPLVSDCNPVDAVECPCCLTVFRVRTLMTDGAGRLMRDEYETIPMFCPMCGGRLDRDWNAALNILDAAGLAESLNACGGDVRRKLAQADHNADPFEAGTHRTARLH